MSNQQPSIRVLKNLYIKSLVLIAIATAFGAFNAYVAASMAKNWYQPGLTDMEPTPQMKEVLTEDKIIDLLFENRYHKLSFDFVAVEGGMFDDKYTSGRTSCGETSYLYIYQGNHVYFPEYTKGIWIEITDCGTEADEIFENIGFQTGTNTVAKMYMPLVALEHIYTFEDYEAAIKQYGVLYNINQPLLAAIIGVDVHKLPVNAQLQKP